MSRVRALRPGEAPALFTALERHVTESAYRMRAFVLRQAIAGAGVAVAILGNEIVGYVANCRDPAGGGDLTECSGEVFPPWRGCGLGGELIDWAIDRAVADRGRSLVMELVIDAGAEDTGLLSLLKARGFGATWFRELTAPAEAPEPMPAARFRRITTGDAGIIEAMYRRGFVSESLSRGGVASVVNVLRHPFLSPEFCLLAGGNAGTASSGYALCLVWPENTTDLWIETICVDPTADSRTVSRQLVAELLRRAAGRFGTVSLGIEESRVATFADLGFTARSSWSRHTLLLMPS
jgi:GNAT superfamily N-acetyltransferase